MAGLVPAIHAFDLAGSKDVDARDKRGHDGSGRDGRLNATIAEQIWSTAVRLERRAGMANSLG